MDTTILQIPVSKTLRNKASAHAAALGFSSLQEAVRIFLTKMAASIIDIRYEEAIPLSPKNARHYDKMIEDIKIGKELTYETKDVDDLLDQLYCRKNPVRAKISKKL